MWHKTFLLAFILLGGDAVTSRDIDLRHVFPKARIQHYIVEGESIAEFKNNIKQKSPSDQFGNLRDAYTGWNISWKWPVEKGVPQYARTKVTLDLSFILPEKNSEFSREEEVKFNSYMNAMIRHEAHHAQMAVDMRGKVEGILHMLPNTTSSIAANRIAETALDELRGLDIEYDKKTHHGMFEGVHLD